MLDLEVEGLFSVTTVYMSNDEPDIRVIEIPDAEDMGSKLMELMGNGASDLTEIVVNNPRANEECCARFHMFISGYQKGDVPNWQFESFLRKIGQQVIGSRCKAVLVVGSTATLASRSFVSIPSHYYTDTSFSKASVCVLGSAYVSQDVEMLDVPGMCLPRHMPENVQWKILSYCRSPTAELIYQYNLQLTRYWDSHFCALSWIVSI